jgi:hypothetical protein
MTDPEHPDSEWNRALDAALRRALPPPALPSQFRARLQSALAREADQDLPAARSRLEREQRERLAELEAGYLRLRRRTLGNLVGGAFAAGVAVALALPWLRESFGANAPLALSGVGVLIGLAIGMAFLKGRHPPFDFM